MIKYDDFCKLPIFKKGWIALDSTNNSIYFYGTKPKWYKYYGTWSGNSSFVYEIDTNFWRVDLKGVKAEESLRKVGGKSKISHYISTDLSIGDEVYILQQDGLWYVYNKTLQITDIYFHYYPRNKTESIGLFLCDDKTDGERSLVYDRKDVYKTKKEAQKECDRRNAELKRKEQK